LRTSVFLKCVHVRTAHLKEKKKKGEVIHRPKIIWGLAKKTRCAAYKDGKTSDLSEILTIYLEFSSSTAMETSASHGTAFRGWFQLPSSLPPPGGAGGKQVYKGAFL
jgi:hypothetical protein